MCGPVLLEHIACSGQLELSFGSGRGSVLGYVSFFFLCTSVNINPICSIPHTKHSDNKSCRIFHAVWWRVVAHWWWRAEYLWGEKGACFRVWLLCFYFLFLLWVNHRPFCFSVCLWEDSWSSCSFSTGRSDCSRRSLSRAGSSCCWLAQMPGADTRVVLINALLLLTRQTDKEIDFFFPPFISTALHRVPGWVLSRCPRPALERSLLVWEEWSDGGGAVSSIPGTPHPGRAQLFPVWRLPAPVSPHPHLHRWQLQRR